MALTLPAAAFGASIDVEKLLDEPELHFAVGLPTSRLVLMPRLGTFSRLVLEWETLPEIGVFAATSWPAGALPDSEIARLETWMRDVAAICHAYRDRIRETSERAVRDSSAGLDRSVPDDTDTAADGGPGHVVSAHVGTRVASPTPDAVHALVDVTEALGERGDPSVFRDRATGELLGRRILVDGEPQLQALATGVSVSDLADWYDQHICREVLFDDVWQVCVHLLAGLEAPASVAYFS